MSKVETQKVLAVPADKVWGTISAFHDIERFLPAVKASTVEGHGVGCLRTCTLTDGAILRERLVELDAERRMLRYKLVEAPFPVDEYVATMEVQDLGDGRCHFLWSSTFRVTSGLPDVFEGIFAQAYAAGAEGLERLHRG